MREPITRVIWETPATSQSLHFLRCVYKALNEFQELLQMGPTELTMIFYSNRIVNYSIRKTAETKKSHLNSYNLKIIQQITRKNVVWATLTN